MPEAQQPGLEGLRHLADELSDGLAVTRAGRIVWANQRLADLVAAPREALLGREPAALVAPGAPALEHGGETRLARESGGPAQVRVLHVCGDTGDDDGTWIFRDLSRAAGLESEVLALGRALREANLELESLRARVKRQRDDLDEVLTVVSHELRTPVTVVSGYARLLLSEDVGPVNDEQRGFLEESLKSCRRLNAFIANLLTNSRDAGTDAPLQVHEASLEPTLREVLQALKPLLDEHGLETELVVGPDTPPARFDPVRVEQVLTNLLENAIKYGRPAGDTTGTVRIGCRGLDQGGREVVEVSVSDEGPGVPEPERARIFDRYVRVGDHRSAGSLGLGLSICRRLVHAHGGVMGVTDSEAGGARFWFTLPAASPPATPEPRES